MGRSSTKQCKKGVSTKRDSHCNDRQSTRPRSLLDLPAELWSRICVLAASADQHLTIPLDATRADYDRFLRQPGITCTCRAIRAETLKHFYNNAIIRIEQRIGHEDLSLLSQWLNAIGEKNRQDIQALPHNSLQQYWKGGKGGQEILVVPLKVQSLPGFCPVGEGEDDDDIIASVRRYVLGPEPISI